MRFIVFFLLLLSSIETTGQQEVHQYFDFKDGLYYSHEALLKNQPDLTLSSDASGVYNNPLKILRVNPIDFGLNAATTIAYVVNQGLPYARVIRCCPDQTIYVGLTIVGHMSVLEYDSEEIVDVPMTAYNPYNNKPFLRGTVKREKSIQVVKAIDFSTGEGYQLTDPSLSELLMAEKPFQDLEELIVYISEFNKNNKIYIAQQ